MKKTLLIGFMVVISFLDVMSQQTESGITPETQYNQARKAAFTGNYVPAREGLTDLLAKLPDYHDASLLLARVYMWEGNYHESKLLLNRLESKIPDSEEVKELSYELSYFSGDYQQVVSKGVELMSAFPDRVDFKDKYDWALWQLGRRKEAGELADLILAKDPANKIALEIKRLLAEPEYPLLLHLNYSFDHFDEPYNRWWHLYSVGLSKKFEGYTISGKLNIGHLQGGDTELQGEIDSYVTLSPKSYLYGMYGYSGGDYFPTHKAALEVWHQLPYKMYGSLGSNYYRWDDHIFIGTASLEKYLGQYWFCFRSYANFKDVGISWAWYLTARRYWNDTDYLQLTLGTGTAPDEPYDIKTDLDRQSAQSVRLLLMKRLISRTMIRAGIGYSYEEYQTDTYRNRFDGTLGIIYLLAK